ncbi:MAG: alpha-ketoglutarate-dependent dioxygenase AlkB [Gammaproteobacteria bacterium]|jgi:alkylated DNA repair dioxygenase AlkB|nr:alpha-ketoglutarate-dependent dioxygenase AlkB [Gammaproteobacteria bacterium]
MSLPDKGFMLCEDFLTAAEATLLYEQLVTRVSWRQDEIVVFGRHHLIPRMHQWYADAGLTYRWSGITMRPKPWVAELESLRRRVSNAAGVRFNSVLANLYRDGDDSMGWHSDDEAELGEQPVIASLSLGAERDFKLRPRHSEIAEQHTVQLTHGSLLVMSGWSQRDWQHSLPKRLRVSDSRVNLTFRRIVVLPQ